MSKFQTSKINPMPSTFPPDWASGWGYDALSRYPFAELKLNTQVRMHFRWIPPGGFLMESSDTWIRSLEIEGLQGWVQLPSGLWIEETPCTQAEWIAMMGSNPSFSQENIECPVEGVNWEDCQKYCQKLNERFPGFKVRLPTVEEWEYACRAGTATSFNDGSNCTVPDGKDPALEKLGWYSGNSGGKTHPVRELSPNTWGIYDMHGNVWEWCQDELVGINDPLNPPPVQGVYRAFRGGSYVNPPYSCRSSYQNWGPQENKVPVVGFRLVSN